MYKVNCTVLYERDLDKVKIVAVVTKRNQMSVVPFNFMAGKHYTSICECDAAIRKMLKQNNLYVGKINSGNGYWSEIIYLSTDGYAGTFFININT